MRKLIMRSGHLEEIAQKRFSEHIEVVDRTRDSLSSIVVEAGKILAKALQQERTVFWAGNGGSAADSQHLAAELVGRFKHDRKALRSIALTTDSSILTCVSNDYSYDDIFSRQIEALGRKGDVFVGISTSGGSKNILRALHAAREIGVHTIAMLGKGGGEAIRVADCSIVIPSDSTARIQETHILVGHILCEVIETELGFG